MYSIFFTPSLSIDIMLLCVFGSSEHTLSAFSMNEESL